MRMAHIANNTGAKRVEELSRLLASTTVYVFKLAIQILGYFTCNHVEAMIPCCTVEFGNTYYPE